MPGIRMRPASPTVTVHIVSIIMSHALTESTVFYRISVNVEAFQFAAIDLLIVLYGLAF